MATPNLHDFRIFLQLVWKHLNLPPPTPVQYDIAHFVQKGPRRCIIEAFRGVGKSYITSAFVCHQLLLNHDLKILVVSASKVRSDDFSTFVQRLIYEMPLLNHLIPSEDQRQSKISFDVGPATASHSPSVKSVGITGQLAGSRADLIVADDIEVPNNSQTQMMRDKLSESVKEFDAVIKPQGRIIFLGTPQCEQSLYELLPDRGYHTCIWPARVPEEKTVDKYEGKLAPYIQQLISSKEPLEPTDPLRFNTYDLDERELSYGRSGFSLQFMLDTSLSDEARYPLKLSDLIIMHTNTDKAPEKIVWSPFPANHIDDLPNVGLKGDRYYGPYHTSGDWIQYTGSVLAIDPAGRGHDETAYCVMKMLNGICYVTDLGGIQGGYTPENLQLLADIAKSESVNMCLIEANFGDGMFTELLKPYLSDTHPVTCEEVKHHTQKEMRIIDALEPLMNQHRLVINHAVIDKDFKSTQHYPHEKALKYQLAYQMTRITRERGSLVHDDRLDVLAIAARYWIDQIAMTQDKAITMRNERLLKNDLDNFIRNIPINNKGNATNGGERWMNLV